MNAKNLSLKIWFGLIIFAFSLALAYFTASYVQSSTQIDYWLVIEAFAGLFVLVGIVVSSIFPVSLGFLYSATVLIINVLLEKYDIIPDINKAVLLGAILVILYLTALAKKEGGSMLTGTPAPASTPAAAAPAASVQSNPAEPAPPAA